MVRITDDWYLDADNTCYSLKQKVIVQDENSKNYGKALYKEQGYYTTIEGALQGMLSKKLKNYIYTQNDISINDLLGEIKKQNEFIKELNINI